MAQVAKVTALTGKAFVVGADGSIRLLKVGDAIEKGEVVRTAAGATVELTMQDGQKAVIAAEQSVRVDDNMTQGEERLAAQESAVATGTIDSIIQALERGGDLTEELEAAAAGGGAGGGGDGSDFVRLLRVTEGVDPLAYEYSFESQSIPDEILQSVDAPPAEPVVGSVTLRYVLLGEDGQPVTGEDGGFVFVDGNDVVEGTPVGVLAEVNVAPTGSDLVLTLSNGTTITIPVGETSGVVALEVRDDEGYVQGDELVDVSVIGASGGQYDELDIDQATSITVVDDSDVTTVTLGNVTYQEGTERATITATLSNVPTTGPLVLTLSNGATITFGTDYVAGTPVTSTEFTVPVIKHGEPGGATDKAVTEPITVSLHTGGDEFEALDFVNGGLTILDGQPTVHADVDSVTEDTALTATGNVLTGVDLTAGNDGNETDGVADTQGADRPVTVTGVAAGNSSANLVSGVGTAVSGSYGSVTIASDGSYTYSLNNGLAAVQTLDGGETLTDTFSYTMQDADGDWKTTTLTITINGTNDKPEVTVNTGNPEGANDIVYEAGLANGSGVGNTTTTAGGTFTLADKDGLEDVKSVTINGTTILIADLGKGEGNVIPTANGALTITDYSDGVATYSYQLNTTTTDVANALESDKFTVTVSDGTESSDPVTITIVIADDAPIARDDVKAVAEDGTLVAEGNVLDNDVSGADTPATFVSWAPATAQHGTIVLNADGSYEYTLDNAAAQSLKEGEIKTEFFSYTMKDADGDEKPATLTITITGTNDAPILDLDGNGGGTLVRESFENLITKGWKVLNSNSFTGDHGVQWTTTGANLEVQAGSVGGASASDGNVKAELDSHNAANTLVQMSTQVVLSGKDVTLSFDYMPRPEARSDSGMLVTLKDADGNVVYSRTMTNADGTNWTSVSTVISGANLLPGSYTLTFQGLGVSNTLGAYLDNITLSEPSGYNYETTFTENGAAVSIADTDVSITDVDDTHIESAVIVLTNAQAGDVLSAGTLPAGIVANQEGNTITLTGSATLADYQAAIKAITFANTSENPDATPRIVQVTVNDGDDNSNTAITTINVIPVNDAPDAKDDSYKTAEDTPLEIAVPGVLVNDTDVDGGALTVTSFTQPSEGGTVTVGQNGNLVFTPTPNYNGPVSFTYTINDGKGGTDTATVNIDVTPVNDKPVVVEVSASGQGLEDSAGIAVTLTATDIDGTVTRFVIGDTTGLNGTLYFNNAAVTTGAEITATNGSATLTFVPDVDESNNNRTFSFNYQAEDNEGGLSQIATANIHVTPVTDAPEVSVTLTESTTSTLYAVDLTNVSGNQGGSSGNPAGFTVTASRDGQPAEISIRAEGFPTGFGVKGQASNGAESEIGKGEALHVKLDTPASSVTFQLSWLNARDETAVYKVSYANGQSATFTISGGSDGIDSPVTVDAPRDTTITAIEFSTPTAGDHRAETSDYLLHSVSYTSATTSYEVDIKATPTDKDHSESITSLTVTTPAGTTLSGATFVSTSGDVTTWKILLDNAGGNTNTVQVDKTTGVVTVSGLILSVPAGYSGPLTVTATAVANDPGAASPVQSSDSETVHVPVTGELAHAISNVTYVLQADFRDTIEVKLDNWDGFRSEVKDPNAPADYEADIEQALAKLVGHDEYEVTGYIIKGGNDTVSVGDTAGADTLHNTNDVVFGKTEAEAGTAAATALQNLQNMTPSENELVGAELDETLTGTAHADILVGGNGNDTLIGGAGNDALIGGAGADVFKWSLGDEGTAGDPAVDHITDFNASEGDTLDLRDLLQGETEATLSQYLSFDEDGDGKAVLSISATANENVTQKVVFDNQSLLELEQAFGASSADDLIAKMKAAGNLDTH